MSSAEFATDTVIGWDIGGAHVKACLLVDGAVRDVAQWACPLWQGLQHLEAALADAQRRWPQWLAPGQSHHAVTMTGEMVDLFTDREDGVRRISALLAQRLKARYGSTPAPASGWRRPTPPRTGRRSPRPTGAPPHSTPQRCWAAGCWSTSAAPPPT